MAMEDINDHFDKELESMMRKAEIIDMKKIDSIYG